MSDIPQWFWDAVDQKPVSDYVKVDEIDIHYQSWSEPGAPGLLFVHGHNAHAHWWDFIAPSFSADRHTVGLDLGGMGDSDHRDSYSANGFADEILAVADAAVDAGATVIGVTSFARTPLTTRADHLLVAGARFQAWDQGILGSGLVQLLVLNALQIAVADRMSDAADRARLAVREEVLDIVADDGSDAEASDVPDVIDHGDGR